MERDPHAQFKWALPADLADPDGAGPGLTAKTTARPARHGNECGTDCKPVNEPDQQQSAFDGSHASWTKAVRMLF